MVKTTLKKRWYKIIAPKLFNNEEIGETTTYEAKSLIGKSINVNFSVLTNDMKRQNQEVHLVIENVEGDKAQTNILGARILPNTIKRIVRKGKTRLDQTIRGVTKDDKIVTVKMFMLTRNIVKGSISRNINHETKRFIVKKVSLMTFDELAEKCDKIGNIKKIDKNDVLEILKLAI